MFAGIMLIRCMGVHFGIFLFYFGEACAHEATSAADFLANWTYTDQGLNYVADPVPCHFSQTHYSAATRLGHRSSRYSQRQQPLKWPNLFGDKNFTEIIHFDSQQ